MDAKTQVKVTAQHCNDAGINTWACGTWVDRGQGTTDPSKVTCKRCLGTRRFARYAERQTLAAAHAVWTRAGLRTGMVVRHLMSGRMGVITELSESIRVSYWGGQHSGAYARLVDFDSACEIVIMADLVPVGTRLVSNLGGEATVEEIGSAGIWTIADGETGAQVRTPSELAAEISRGWLAIVPTIKCRACNVVLSNSQNHKHFDRPLTWPDMAEPPTALLKRDAGDVWVKLSDIIEVGNRVNFGYGSADNGDVVAVTWHAATVKRADGTQYLWTLTEIARELNRANVSVYMPDSNGRPIGSWR